jgi:PadR family transcriptional regulator, regulatory protein AphA
MPRENRSKFAILGMLAMYPMSGYDIRKCAAFSIAHFWKEDYGHIYPTLKFLLEEGLTERESGAASGRTERQVYAITEKGRRALAEWLKEMPNPPNLRIELLLKVFLGSGAEPEILARMLEAQEAACRAAYEELLETEEHLGADIAMGGALGREARFQLMTLRYGKSYYESLGTWCRETLEELRAL